MTKLIKNIKTSRYAKVSDEKAEGATYTPKVLADFVAKQIVQSIKNIPCDRPLRILDPAIGDGQLLISLLEEIHNYSDLQIQVFGFETDSNALDIARTRLSKKYPYLSFDLKERDFLEFVLKQCNKNENYDLVIANPPYVRTQIMGASKAQMLSEHFGLSGRIDLYYAFVAAISRVLDKKGIMGLIVSNRFMTTRSGASVRKAFLEQFNIQHIWDFGDSKIFNAAVLPAVILASGKNGRKSSLPTFTSIYETRDIPSIQRKKAKSPIEAVCYTGNVLVGDDKTFFVQQGRLNTGEQGHGVWRIENEETESWLETVKAHTWKTFGEIGKVRVGVKTCADKVFIRSDWERIAESERPELLKPLITHHIARRYKAIESDEQRQIIYPHEVKGGKRQTIDISLYPQSRAYLEGYRKSLENRKYLLDAGREWYEIWVPHDPSAWEKTKLVFRDISAEPIFWVDKTGAVVNGDCYWFITNDSTQTDLLWLAVAIGNSHFIEKFYDSSFPNKLYAGRRRFITQYVEKFPLPDPNLDESKEIISTAKSVYEYVDSPQGKKLHQKLEQLVFNAFGLCL